MSEAAPENGEVQEVPAEDVAPPPTGLGVSVTQGLPDVTMIVNEGNEISPSGEDRTYYGGEQIMVSGPEAIALAAGGHASVVGPSAAPSENGASAEAVAEEVPVAEEAPVEEAPPAEEAPAE